MADIYLAAPLFSEAERSFNERLTADLERFATVFLPQRDGRLIIDLLAEGCDVGQAKRLIFERDLDAIQAADLLIAVLDGRGVDEGVAVELGLAFAYGKQCWGLKTDFRTLAWFGDNPMVEVILSRHFGSVFDLVAAAAVHYHHSASNRSRSAAT